MLTLIEAAEQLNVSPRTVQRKAKLGEIERVATTNGIRYVLNSSTIRRAPTARTIDHPDAVIEEIFHLRAEMESLRRRMATQTEEIEELRAAVLDYGFYIRPRH